ncbi:hypothetical protein GGQ88_003515 [Novosphingobium hassiacum]|uniref:Uncharacterized protein n=1 Tax=Novosphingobium hassiacum TaxID=173676 RepID=A0A7W6EXB0_9SPHN|nr:hypothetical protein [Novosphingobium hassiacum]
MAKSLKVLRATLMRETQAPCGKHYLKPAEIHAGSAGSRAGNTPPNNPIERKGDTYRSPFSLDWRE